MKDFFFTWVKKRHLGSKSMRGVEFVDDYGFRNDHKYTDTDVVALGCSDTFGVGNYYNDLWVTHLSKELNKPVTNLGMPGGSMQACYRILSGYIHKKWPLKKVYLLAPSRYRLELIFGNIVADGEVIEEGGYRLILPNAHHNEFTDEEIVELCRLRLEKELTDGLFVNLNYELCLNGIKHLCSSNGVELVHFDHPMFKSKENEQAILKLFSKDKALDKMHLGPKFQKFLFEIMTEKKAIDHLFI